MKMKVGKNFEPWCHPGQVILESNEHPNGRKTRTVGVIINCEVLTEGRRKGQTHVILNPLPEYLAKPIRDQYCTNEYNYQGHTNSYSDKYGFASHYLVPETTQILFEVEVRGRGYWTTFRPVKGV